MKKQEETAIPLGQQKLGLRHAFHEAARSFTKGKTLFLTQGLLNYHFLSLKFQKVIFLPINYIC